MIIIRMVYGSMERIKELRMTLIILLIGMFFFSGCFFSDKYEVAFKTNGGSEIENVMVKSGNYLEEPDTPTKEGYVFEGWYLDGDEYDFDEEVKSDMTLVAKWRKVDIADEPEDKEEETTTTTSTTTKLVITTSTISVKVKTTKKVTTTPKKTTTNSTEKTTKTTSTSTTKVIESPTKPTDPIIPDKKEELKMHVDEVEIIPEEEEELEEIDNLSPMVEVMNKYRYDISFNSEDVNVISEVSEEDLQEILKSDKSKWIIYNHSGYKYTNNYSIVNNNMSLEGDYQTSSITFGITAGNVVKYYTLDKVITKNTNILEDRSELEEEVTWHINYPNVSLTTKKIHVEDDILPTNDGTLEIYYFSSLEDAIKLANENDSIALLKDMNISNTIEIDKLINLIGNNHKITFVEDILESTSVNLDVYLFHIKDIDDEEGIMKIENLEVDVNSFINIDESNNFKELDLNNVKTRYRRQYIINKAKVTIVQSGNSSFTPYSVL